MMLHVCDVLLFCALVLVCRYSTDTKESGRVYSENGSGGVAGWKWKLSGDKRLRLR